MPKDDEDLALERLPELLGSGVILARVTLSSQHAATDWTRRFYEEHQFPEPVELQVVGYPDESSCELVSYDKWGERIFATAHDSFEQACERAEWAFRVTPDEWVNRS